MSFRESCRIQGTEFSQSISSSRALPDARNDGESAVPRLS
jgi:hypothetical protein